jgi:hypothetical protein
MRTEIAMAMAKPRLRRKVRRSPEFQPERPDPRTTGLARSVMR